LHFNKNNNVVNCTRIKNITLPFQNYAINATNQKDPQGEHVCIFIHIQFSNQQLIDKTAAKYYVEFSDISAAVLQTSSVWFSKESDFALADLNLSADLIVSQ